MIDASGFAVAKDGIIDVKTVSPTKLGAAVNWLHPRRSVVFDGDTSEHIFTMFQRLADRESAQIVAVVISEDRSSRPSATIVR